MDALAALGADYLETPDLRRRVGGDVQALPAFATQ
jgi:hypothetical protein